MKNSVILILLLGMFSSCSVYFSSSMKRELDRNNVDLRKIQFYNSHPFVLQRELASSETKVESGRIKTKGGKEVEIIVFSKGKPGVCDSISDNTLFLIFEHGENTRIPFSPASSFFVLDFPPSRTPITSITNHSNVLGVKFYGTIEYDGKVYYFGYAKKPKLKVKRKQVDKVLKEVREVAGVRIN